MAFPQTAVLSSFTGNENPISEGGAWSHDTHLENTAAQKTGGILTGSTTDFWDAIYQTDFGPYCENYIGITTMSDEAIIMRVKTTNVAGGGNDYHFFYIGSSWGVYRSFNGIVTQLGDGFTQTISTGDTIGISYDQGDVIVYYKSGAGAWTEKARVHDTTFLNQLGKNTIESNNNVIQFDNFGGGTINPQVVAWLKA